MHEMGMVRMKMNRKVKRRAAVLGTVLLGVLAAAPVYGGEWRKDGTGWWYLHEDGSFLADQYVEIDGKFYGFDPSGYMVTGWRQIDGEWYYFRADGSSVRGGWVEGKYYMDDDGTMLAGAMTPDGYYVGEDGVWQETPPEAEKTEKEETEKEAKERKIQAKELR